MKPMNHITIAAQFAQGVATAKAVIALAQLYNVKAAGFDSRDSRSSDN